MHGRHWGKDCAGPSEGCMGEPEQGRGCMRGCAESPNSPRIKGLINQGIKGERPRPSTSLFPKMIPNSSSSLSPKMTTPKPSTSLFPQAKHTSLSSRWPPSRARACPKLSRAEMCPYT